MTTNLIAITHAVPVYPGYLSINREDDGSVTVHLRGAPLHHDTMRACGKSCFPGQAGCNNWCGYNADGGRPANPEGIDVISPGETVTLKIKGSDWDAAIAGLLAG
ncbi:MAG: hypothetical protein JHD35_16235 [Sphingopyxis sp.]|nr:hypothetical protein [Sphingopyxis sp.]